MRGNQLLKIVDRFLGAAVLFILGLCRRKNYTVPANPQKIVVIKLSAIGDTILLYPALRAIRKRYPSSKIIAIGTRINREIFLRCPYVDQVLSVDFRNILFHPIQFLSPLCTIQPEISIDFDQWTRVSAMLAIATRQQHLIGFYTPRQYRHFAYDRAIPHNRTTHEIECFLSLAQAIDASSNDTLLEFVIHPDEYVQALRFLDDHHLNAAEYIVFHPETPLHGKQRAWPTENYVDLGLKISRETGVKVLLTGTSSEYDSNMAMQSLIGVQAICVPPVGIGVLAAIFEKAALLVCGNTGVMHLACALNTPVVALHGPTDSVKWGPRSTSSIAVSSDLPCSPCLYLGFEYGCKTNTCMQAISPDMVLGSVKKILQTQS